MDPKPCAALLVVAMLCPACGEGGGPTSPTPTPSPQIAGEYDVAVRLTENSCGVSVTVQPQPTSVTHAPGAIAFTLVHGGLRLTGSVSRDGTFTTQPLSVQDPLGPAQLAIVGRFTTTGLDATAGVDVQRAQPAATCRYAVAWSGAKRGAPNVIG